MIEDIDIICESDELNEMKDQSSYSSNEESKSKDDFICLRFHKNELKVIKRKEDIKENNDSFEYLNFTGNEFKSEQSKKNDKAQKYDLAILVTGYNEGMNEYTKTITGIENDLKRYNSSKNLHIAIIFIIDGIEHFIKGMGIKSIQKPNINDYEIDKQNKYLNTEPPIVQRQSFKDKIPNFCDIEKFEKFIKFLEPLNQNNGTLNQLKKPEYSILFNDEYNSNDETAPIDMSLYFCIKEKNKKKLNSQDWFLRGFCKVFQPDFFMFIDSGTSPQKNSIKLLYECLRDNDDVAGCCGEIIPENSSCMQIVNQAQIVEYKFAHLFDKTFENLFGFISVLPGAFSAYRYKCFNKNLLDIYFLTETNKKLSLSFANMYLAEDRILCLELMCQKGRKNILRYIPNSKALTDAPSTLPDLMVQRRRWINGSWYSTVYIILNCTKIHQSKHSNIRKCCFGLLLIYSAISAMFTWFQVSILYLSFAISLKRALGESNNDLNKLDKISTPIIMVYVSALIACMILSLSVPPKKIKLFLECIAAVFSFYTFFTLGLTLKFLFARNEIPDIESRNSASFMAISATIIFIFLVLMRFPIDALWKVFKGIFSYFCMTGAYSNIFLINAISNIHDVSWGNRPSNSISNDGQESEYEAQRITWVVIWILSNSIFSVFFNWTDGRDDQNASIYFNILAWFIFFIIFFKIMAAFLYYWCCSCCRCKRNR